MEKSTDTTHILVVDEEKDIRDRSKRILSKIGFQVMTASRAEEALDLLEREKPSIVFLDLKMIGMGGMEVLEQVRKIDETILVIIITEYAKIKLAIKAVKQGAYDFILKPVEPDQMHIVINRACEKIRLIYEAEKLERKRIRSLLDLGYDKSHIHTIFESFPMGAMLTNTDGQLVLMNSAFRQLFDLSPDLKPDSQIEDYVSDKGLCDLVKEISQGKYIDHNDIPDYELNLSDKKYLLAKAQPVLDGKQKCLGTVVNVMDISNMKVLDQLKSEFVAKVSHELRSPLSTIHEQLALVIKNMAGEASTDDQHILTRAKEKTQGLISLIGDLLDLSRIEEGIICHEPKPVKLEEILENIVDFLKTRADGKKQSLTLDFINTPLPLMVADPIALESIFGNLITNAINYTQDGGKITVRADLSGINIKVQVIDNGFGIEDRHLENIFERFYRIKNEKTRYITGTGLGLPIVEELTKSLGGLIDVKSNPGRGSTFTVLLPIK